MKRCGCEVRKRLDQVPPYLFAELERKIAEKRREGIDVISLGIGDPDLPTPAPVDRRARRGGPRPRHAPVPDESRLRRVSRGRGRRSTATASASTSIPAPRSSRRSAARRPSATSASRCSTRATCASRPTRATRPTRPARSSRARRCTTCRSTRQNAFLPDLGSIPGDILARANVLFLNYPNNPTGAIVEPGYFDAAVEFARANDLVVVHDNAYSEICFDGYRAPSFLETPGAKEVGIEIFSLSKGWNMTGWRSGVVAGNADVVERYRQLKTNLDSGMFEAVQHATAVALTEARDFPREMSEIYTRRRDLVAEALAAIGLPVDPPKATPYFWVRVPDGYTSESFAELVLQEAAVVVSPGPAYGPSGEGFFRISLTVADERLEEAVRRIESTLRAGIIGA